MGGSSEVITAVTMSELKTKVEEWYERAAGMGLEDMRIPWDETRALRTDEGYEFSVWAHS